MEASDGTYVFKCLLVQLLLKKNNQKEVCGVRVNRRMKEKRNAFDYLNEYQLCIHSDR